MEDVAFSLEGKTDSEPSRFSSCSLSSVVGQRKGGGALVGYTLREKAPRDVLSVFLKRKVNAI
jgi:hypothetical protein